VVNMTVETMARLSKLKNIAGVKDATADLARPTQMRIAAGPEFCQMSGEDGTALAFFAQGGHGCISVTANIAPRRCVEVYQAWAAGDAKKALELHTRLMPLHDAMFAPAAGHAAAGEPRAHREGDARRRIDPLSVILVRAPES
jgi:4-hydroxy-tetrahydrodipicolinate synthase